MDNNIALFDAMRTALELGKGVDGAIRESEAMLNSLHKVLDNEPGLPAKAVRDVIAEADRLTKESADTLDARLFKFTSKLMEKLGLKAERMDDKPLNTGLTYNEMIKRYLGSAHFDTAAKVRIINNLDLPKEERTALINSYVNNLKHRQNTLGDTLGHGLGYHNVGRYYKTISPDFIWLSIIDKVTSDFCRARNGLVFHWADDPVVPPAHYNCRSTIAPYYNKKPMPDEAKIAKMLNKLKRQD